MSGAGAFAVGPGASEVLSGSDTYSGGTTIGAAGTQEIRYGGQFDMTPATTAQAYTGTLAVTVNYN